MRKHISTFKGRLPRLGAKNLPDGYAQTATNVDLRSGNVEPFKALLQGSALTGAIISSHPIDTETFVSTLDCNFVDHDISGTAVLIVSDGTAYPKQYTDALYPTDHMRLGMVAPTDTLTITYSTISAISSTEVGGTYSWVYTYVNAWGEESKPSPATAAVDVNLNQYVTLTNFDIFSAADKNLVTGMRIYRLATGTLGAEYQFLEEIDDQATTYDDYNTNVGLNTVSDDVLATENYDQPPATLAGILRYANGMLAGFAGASLYLSEPFIVYAWPDEYVIDFDSDIVAIAAYNDAIIVMTNKKPYIVTGTSPESMMVTPVNIDKKCVAKRGVVESPLGVFYPSPDGYVLVTGAEAETVTKNIITKEQWLALTPANLISFWYDDQLYCFIKNVDTGFIIIDGSWVDLDLGTSGVVVGGYVDVTTDKLVLIMNRTTYYPETFNAHATNYLAWTYKTKQYNFTFPSSWSCFKLYGISTGNIAMTFYGDAASLSAQNVSSQLMGRLLCLHRYYDWDVQFVSATGTVKRTIEDVVFANSPSELMLEEQA